MSERLQEIKLRLAAAQPDEWHVNDFTNEATAPSKDALRWLLHAPEDMAWLIAQVVAAGSSSETEEP